MKRILIFAIAVACCMSCDNKQERIEELEYENNGLRERISELEDENEALEGQITELQERLENAQSSIDDARFDLLNGQFGLGLDDLDDAESELYY
jgi:predicted nuclease with TOPRIM domain